MYSIVLQSNLSDRGAEVTAEITSGHYRKSPLFQSRLEVRCFVTATLPKTIRGQLILSKYEEMVQKHYTEPKEETIMGSFLSKPEALKIDEITHWNERKRKNNMKKNNNAVKCKI